MAHDRRGARRARWVWSLALVAGVVVAVVLWVVAGMRYDDAVSDLAPAPAGCDTTLVFDRTGTYTFFLETKGEIGRLDGDCDRDDREYELDEDDPRVQLTLTTDGGDEVDLDRASGPSYDRSGSVGVAIRKVDIDDEGEYVLSVESPDDEVVVRVGRDPSSGVTMLRGLAGLALAAGLLITIVGLLAGRSRATPASAGPPAPALWPQVPGQLPTAPPVAPGPRPPYTLGPPPTTRPGQPLPPPPPPRGFPPPPPRP